MTKPERRTAWRLAAILLLALGLRLINLGVRTLWYDEAFAVLFAETGWDAMIDGTITTVDGAAAEEHPLLYYFALNVWIDGLGRDPAAVRLFSVLAGVATVAVVYALVRDWFDESTALAAAFICAVAPFHVQYSQETRMYALLGLVLMLATWAYGRAWHRGQPVYWIAFGVLAAAAMYVQQLAVFYLFAVALLPVLARDRRRLLQTTFAAVLALLLYLPWLRYLPDQLGKLKQFWVQKPNILHFWLTLRSFISVNLDFSAAWWVPTFLLAAILTFFVLYRAYFVLRSDRSEQNDRQAVGWTLWLAFMPMVFMWVASYLFQPVFLPRALLPSAVMFYAGLAWLFVRGGMPRLIVGILVAAWVVVMGFGLVTHYTWDTFPTPPFDDAVDYLDANAAVGDMIVHGNKITALPMIYYDRDLPQRFVRDIPGSGSDTLSRPTQESLGLLADACPAAAAGGAPRVWYVAFEQFEDEMADQVDDDPANARYDTLSWLRSHYHEQCLESFNDLDVYLFVDPDPDALRATCNQDER
ncbi:MAG: glycosyltransferase family 39 protein [Anaerolineae bacterium]|nr:glycosyltransferase family 39 protein [Anaerolineae bacterium]